MFLWESIVDCLRLIIVTNAQLCGGNLGGGILLASAVFRAALLPLTLKMAKIAHAHQEALKKLKPAIDEIAKKYRDQPERRDQATRELFRKRGVAQVPLAGCLGGLGLAPLYIAFYSAVRQVADLGGRFFWIRNIAKPDMWLTTVVAGLAFCAVLFPASPPSPELRRTMLVLPVIITVAVLLKTSAGVALYFGVSTAFSLIQSSILRRSMSAAA